jgi:pimeloyl-ACP methyl ester carboxylesterase
MEPKLPLVTAPTLIIRPTDDPFAGADATKLAARLPAARLADLPGGMIPAPDQLPEEFARLVMEFLDE